MLEYAGTVQQEFIAKSDRVKVKEILCLDRRCLIYCALSKNFNSQVTIVPHSVEISFGFSTILSASCILYVVVFMCCVLCTLAFDEYLVIRDAFEVCSSDLLQRL